MQVEQEILDFWQKNEIYRKAKEKNKGKAKFYFLDGPPYTSGRVHIGTAWNKAFKDMLLRYKRMRGFDVWDRAGYDMHGLPVEHAVEEKLGIKHKDEIPKFGVARFIEECRNFALTNAKLMSKDFKRLGVWMDFDNAYMSIKNEFIEGVWFLVKKAYEKGRLYLGEKVMHWCPKCATALAKHELDYKNVKDASVFLKFKIKGKENEYLVIWTTTPWTIPFNLGVMVHPEFDYVKVKVDDEYWIVAKGLAGAFIQGVVGKKLEIVDEFKGRELEGLEYEHPLYEVLKDIYDKLKKEHPNVHTVVLSDEYVDLSAGTGLVHMAPGCGPEDYEVGHKYKIPPFNNIDEEGRFPAEMGKFAGFIARKDDKKFIEEFEKVGCLIAKSDVEHEYAHCWRCKQPVIFRTTLQWFFKVEDLIERMRELNKKVKWVPEWAGSRQFDNWLANLRDNSITRQRYWGTPVPIWKCDKCDAFIVIGSVKELKEHAAVPEDLHRPWIDDVTFRCKHCDGTMHRIADVLDVWIDAGTTSWTCLDYPQREDLFKQLWPADFILEGKDQIRGWFNLLLIASMIAFEKHSYKAVYMHGFVNDALGRKMSKSLGNVISPYEVIDKYGADVLRYYMIGGAEPGVDINYNFDDMRVKARNLSVLWNTYRFVLDLAKQVQLKEFDESALGVEERYIISRLHSTIKRVSELFENYILNEIPWEVEKLFLDLSRIYIKLVREKLIDEKGKEIVLFTCFKVLLECLKLFAPVAPFICERIYQGLRKVFGIKVESIHLFDWPEYDNRLIDSELEYKFDVMNRIISAILSVRDRIKRGVRWPLSKAVVVGDEKIRNVAEEFADLIKRQANVKELIAEESFGRLERIKADFSKIESEFDEKTAAKIIAAIATTSAETIAEHISKEGKFEVETDGRKIAVKKEHLIFEYSMPKNYESEEFYGGKVYVNTELTPELEAEGYAREVMRRIQTLRKKAGLEKRQKIVLHIKADEELVSMLRNFEEQIMDRVGAEHIKITTIKPARKHEWVSIEKIKNKELQIAFDLVK